MVSDKTKTNCRTKFTVRFLQRKRSGSLWTRYKENVFVYYYHNSQKRKKIVKRNSYFVQIQKLLLRYLAAVGKIIAAVIREDSEVIPS